MSSTKRAQAGFTLMEILVVAAMIALLAAIAVINIQGAFLQNQRKATLGEIRSVATALSFCYDDTQIYPKLCFLTQNIFFIAPPTTLPSTQPGSYLVSGFNYIGYEVNPPGAPSTVASRIIRQWANGTTSQGYFSAGQGRRGFYQGRRGGMVKMEIPLDIYNPQVIGPGQQLPIYDWPADFWGRPYVVYLLHLEGIQQNGLPRVRFVNSLTDDPNYVRAVVSYGPNGMPGGPENYNSAVLAIGLQFCLYSRDDRQYPMESDYRCLRPSEYDAARRDAWSYKDLRGENPPTTWIGVADPGSDDLIMPF